MKRLCLIAVAMWVIAAVNVNARSVVGQWDFNGNLDPTSGLGVALTYTDGLAMPVVFQNATIAGQAAQVARFGDWGSDDDASLSQAVNSYFTVTNAVGGNGGGAYTNQFTIIMDVRFPDPAPNAAGWISLFQTALGGNNNDGDWFIRNIDAGTGISGDYTDTGNALRFARGEWQRLALVIDTTTDRYRSYINGQLQNVVGVGGLDGRFSLDTAFHVFADDDGDTQEGQINSLQFRDYAMGDVEIAALGTPTASGIPMTQPSFRLKANVAGSSGCALEGRKVTVTVSGTNETVVGAVGAGGVVDIEMISRGVRDVRLKVDGTLRKKFTLNLTGDEINLGNLGLDTNDVNCDGIVDDADLTLIILSFGAEDE